MVFEAWTGKCPNHPTSQPYFPLSPIWLQLLFEYLSIWIRRCHRDLGFYLSFSLSAGEYDDILPWPVPKTIQIKVSNEINPLNTWSQIIDSKELTKPTTNEYSTIPTVRHPYFLPHSKLFNGTDGYLHNDTIYIEMSFSDPPMLPTQCSLLFPFP